MNYVLEFISSKLLIGLVLIAAAIAWWFGLEWLLETVLEWDPKTAFLLDLLLRGTGALVLGIAGLIYTCSALTD